MTPDDVPPRFAVDFAGATLLGIYRVERKIADGGMGSVWLGEDTNLGRKVVVKVPHVRFLAEPGFRARFQREIAELVRLEHPNIVRILAQGSHEEIPFFVLQYLGGGSLEDRLKAAGEVPRSADAVAPWLRTIAATLDFVHGRGVVHRDVKPENILFDEEGHVFLSDFGLVKALDEDLDVTEAGTGVGSPKYMAPEQGLGREVTGAADQYGLASAVYEAIAGRLPFEGAAALEILLKKREDAPASLGDLAPDLPPSSAAAVMSGIAADPERRFPTCEALADAFLQGAGIFDRTPATGVPALEAPRRSHFTAPAGLALVAALVLALGFVAGWFSPRTPTPEATGIGDAALNMVLLSPGAEPRRVLRYRPVPGARETLRIGITTRESKQRGDQEAKEVDFPRISTHLRFEVGDVAKNGDVSFAWESLETTLATGAGTPPPALEAMRRVTKSLEGMRGSGRHSARGVNLDLDNDTPPPAEAGAEPLYKMITELVRQVSTPLPKEAVGVGARWEVTHATNHLEGIRLTQTVIYELKSLGENEARIQMYVVVAALNQILEHPDLPAEANARLKRVHGDGEGELVIEFDRLGDRKLWMTVKSQAELTVSEEGEEQAVSIGREMRIESERE